MYFDSGLAYSVVDVKGFIPCVGVELSVYYSHV